MWLISFPKKELQLSFNIKLVSKNKGCNKQFYIINILVKISKFIIHKIVIINQSENISANWLFYQYPWIIFPSKQEYHPYPLIMSFSKFPTKFYPLLKTIFPLPCFKSSSNYPKYYQIYLSNTAKIHRLNQNYYNQKSIEE